MRRTRRLVVVRHVAAITRQWQCREIVIHMARRTFHRRVSPDQRELRLRMVKCRRQPTLRRVALRTCRREPTSSVRRIIRPVEILRMARVAIRRRSLEDAINVALGARHLLVLPRQRKFRLVVIKGRRTPTSCRMTQFARRRKLHLHMVGFRRPLKILQMAGRTSRRSSRVLPADMALQARNLLMQTSQRILRVLRVVKLRIQPIRCRVTGSAVLRQTQFHVAWIVGSNKRRLVAGVAVRGCPLVLVVQMARRTLQCRVHSRQRVSSCGKVVKLPAQPVVHRMATRACRRKSKTHMRKLSRLKILQMATYAVRREPLELTHCRARMATHALHQRVRSHQGKTIRVILNVLKGYFPSLD